MALDVDGFLLGFRCRLGDCLLDPFLVRGLDLAVLGAGSGPAAAALLEDGCATSPCRACLCLGDVGVEDGAAGASESCLYGQNTHRMRDKFLLECNLSANTLCLSTLTRLSRTHYVFVEYRVCRVAQLRHAVVENCSLRQQPRYFGRSRRGFACCCEVC